MTTDLILNNIKTFLSDSGISQKFISDKSGMEKNKLSRILNGYQAASLENLESICKSLGRTLEFFNDENFKSYRDFDNGNIQVSFSFSEPSEQVIQEAKLIIKLIEHINSLDSSLENSKQTLYGF